MVTTGHVSKKRIEEMEDWNLLIVDMVRMLYEDDHDHK